MARAGGALFTRPWRNLDLTVALRPGDDDLMRRLLFSLSAAGAAAVVAVVPAPPGHAAPPWFQAKVGNATQVLSVVSTGGSTAKMDVWQRAATGWQPVGSGIPVHVGEAGMAPEARDDVPATPMGVYSLDFAFGTQPNPGGGLKYYQTTPDYWWSAQGPTYNTMQVCKQADCPFDTSRPVVPRTSTSRPTPTLWSWGSTRNASPATAAHSLCTPPTAVRRRAASGSTTPHWSRSCGGCNPAR